MDYLHILLVEDNRGDAELLKTAITRVSGDVNLTWHMTAESAITDIASGHDFDLAIVDLNLPAMSGLQFISHFAWFPQVDKMPVIVFSSSEAPADVDAAYMERTASYIVKPSDIHGYDRLAQYVISCWRGDLSPSAGVTIKHKSDR